MRGGGARLMTTRRPLAERAAIAEAAVKELLARREGAQPRQRAKIVREVADAWRVARSTLYRWTARHREGLPPIRPRKREGAGSRAICERARRWLPSRFPEYGGVAAAYRRFVGKCAHAGLHVPHVGTFRRALRERCCGQKPVRPPTLPPLDPTRCPFCGTALPKEPRRAEPKRGRTE